MTSERLLPRGVLADQIRDRLLEGILAGRYPPDSRIVETQVARQLGTSQAPVREALRKLEAVGVVEILPFRGARVRRPSRRELLEAYVVRSALESLAARLAVPRMNDRDLEALAADVAAMGASARAGDPPAVADADARFHARIVELAGNAALAKVWRSLEPFSRTYISLVVPGADPTWSANLHHPILEELRRRDADAVARALEEHFVAAGENMARRWSDAGLPPDDQPTTQRTRAQASRATTLEPPRSRTTRTASGRRS
jgi:DNA-binding GntR family transcriptional regulator